MFQKLSEMAGQQEDMDQIFPKYESRGARYGFRNRWQEGIRLGQVRAYTSYSIGAKELDYHALKENEIRLLEVLPGEPDDAVTARLCQVSLDDLPGFEALSYSWGTDEPTRKMVIDGKSFSIRPNLEDALRMFRRAPPGDEKAENAAEEFSLLWDRVRYLVVQNPVHPNHPKFRYGMLGSPVTSDVGRQAVLTCGSQGESELDKYIDLLREQRSAISTKRTKANEIKKEIASVLLLLEKRVRELRGLWRLYATPSGIVRSTSKTRILWIDAICINQEDTEEKNVQIKLMRRIYQEAETLLVWLGDDDGDNGAAVGLITEVAKRWERDGLGMIEWLSPTSEENRLLISRRPWYSLALFFCAQWFRRAWVVQEYLVGSTGRSADTMFYYGKSRITANALEHFSQAVERYDRRIYILVQDSMRLHPRFYKWHGPVRLDNAPLWGEPSFYNLGKTFKMGVESWTLLRRMREDYMRSRGAFQEDVDSPAECRRLAPWLQRLQPTLATNPLDKVYSIAGLVHDLNTGTEPLDFIPELIIEDYAASIQDVYSSVVKAIVERTKSLMILGACNRRGAYIKRSWIPDWTQSPGTGILSIHLLREDYPVIEKPPEFYHRASKEEVASVIFADDMSTMTVKGLLWDKITLTSAAFPSENDEPPLNDREIEDPLDVLFRDIGTIWERAKCGTGFQNEQDKMDCVWRTLVSPMELFEKDFSVSDYSAEHWRRTLQEIIHDDTSNSWDEYADGSPPLFPIPNEGDWPEPPSSPSHLPLSFTLEEEEEVGERLPLPLDYNPSRRDASSQFWTSFSMMASSETKLMLTEQGYVGLGTNRAEVGDIICVLLGCIVPVILRPVGENFEYVGDVYVHGIMQGEAIDKWRAGDIGLQDFGLC